MNRALHLFASGALVFALVGCGSTPDAAPTTEPAPAVSKSVEPTTTEPAETTPAAPDPLEPCADILDGGDNSLLERIPALLNGIGADLSEEQIDELVDIEFKLRVAEKRSPEGLADQIATLAEPFQEFADVYAAGGGELNMDTSHVFEDVTAITGTCADAGFKFADAE